jgi:hypothetical protein
MPSDLVPLPGDPPHRARRLRRCRAGCGQPRVRLRNGTGGRLENAIVENWVEHGVRLLPRTARSTSYPGFRLFNNGSTPYDPPGEPAVRRFGNRRNQRPRGSSHLSGRYSGLLQQRRRHRRRAAFRYFLAAATPAADDCAAADPFFDSAPYPGAFNTSGNWLTSVKPCCPAGNPFAIIGGQRCWISFDTN